MPVELVEPINPATGKPLEPIASASEADVERAVAEARAALASWRFTPPAQRAQYLRDVADVLESRADEISETITSEMGRVRAESRPEVVKSAAFFRYFADIGPDALFPTELDLTGLTLAEKSAQIRYEPRGVVGVIKPWNAPVQQIVWAVAPALMAGCSVVVKPSEFTPRSALALQAALRDAGLPKGVCTTLVGGPRIGEALVSSDVDMVTFTGSISSGRKVAAASGARIRKCLLELSGKDSLIVDANVDNVDMVASGIVYGAFSNCGHWCSSVERVLLPASRYDELTAAVLAKVAALRVGATSTGVDIGPIANRKQFEIVQAIVQDAVSRGANILAGGRARVVDGFEGGFFYEPTVLSQVPRDARLETENVFGPVVALESYETVSDAVERANATNYGLGLSVWTDSTEFAEIVTARSDTGMVWINEPLQSVAACPWSVTKDSGIGTELGISGLREFTYEKVVNSQLDGNESDRRAWYFPYA